MESIGKAAVKRKNAKLNSRLKISRKRAKESSGKVREQGQEIRRLRRRVEELEENHVTEYCPNCETEIEMVWNVEQFGYKAYCPVCGERLMLCDECQHGPDGEFLDRCNYDYGTDSCRYNQREGGTVK